MRSWRMLMRPAAMLSLALVAMAAQGQVAADGGAVVGTVQALGASASGAPLLRIRGQDYFLGAGSRVTLPGGAAAPADALRPGTRVRLSLRRSDGQLQIERAEILPD